MESVRDTIKKLLRFTFLFLFLFTILIFNKILIFFPSMFKKFHKRMHKHGPMAKTDYTMEDHAYSWATWSAWLQIWHRVHQTLYENVKPGGKAPNPKVLSQDGATEYNLLDFAKPGRLLVLNFGSCS